MSGQRIPQLITTTVPGTAHRLKTEPFIPGSDVQVGAGTITDAGVTPNTRIRPGEVMVLRTSTGKYVSANDANGDRNAPASVSALETADIDWQNMVYTITVDGGVSFTVTLGATDDTDAEVVTALNANAVFAANCIADVNAGVVRIRTLEGGTEKTLTVVSDLATAYGAAPGISAKGTDADYRVSERYMDLADENGTAIEGIVATSLVGFYDLSELRNITAEAQAVLTRRGSYFG